MGNTALIQVRERNYEHEGRAFVAQVLEMGGADYMTVSQAAEALGVTEGGVRQSIHAHDLHIISTSEDVLAELKSLQVIPLRSARANLLPKETVKALTKIMNTPHAWAAYWSLWEDTAELAEIKADRPLNTSEEIRLRTAISDRSRMFEHKPYVLGAMERDLCWVYFGRGAFNRMTLSQLPAAKLDAAMDLVGSWTKQLSPLTRAQEKNFKAWMNAVTKEPARTADAELLASLIAEEVE